MRLVALAAIAGLTLACGPKKPTAAEVFAQTRASADAQVLAAVKAEARSTRELAQLSGTEVSATSRVGGGQGDGGPLPGHQRTGSSHSGNDRGAQRRGA